jgi:hypothetical protein
VTERDQHPSAGSDPTDDDDNAVSVGAEGELIVEPDPKTSEFDERRWDRGHAAGIGSARLRFGEPVDGAVDRPPGTRRPAAWHVALSR